VSIFLSDKTGNFLQKYTFFEQSFKFCKKNIKKTAYWSVGGFAKAGNTAFIRLTLLLTLQTKKIGVTIVDSLGDFLLAC